MKTATYSAGPAAAALSQRILRFPLTRIILALTFFMVPFILIQAGATHYFDNKLLARMGQLLGVCVACLSYGFYVLKIEKRELSELAFAGAVREYCTGFAIGGVMVCASVAVITVLGGLRALSVAPNSIIVLPLIMHITVGLLEEMMLRVIFFRILQESVGTWLALLASSLVFGAMHLLNDNVSALGIANTVAAGAFLAAAYMLTGRLWLCAALHAALNFFQDGIFSLAVSGHKVRDGLLVTEMSGPDWLTGGAFGIEGSAVDLVFLIAAGAAMLMMAWRKGRFVQPAWKVS